MKRLFSLSIIIIAALLFWGSQTWEKKTAIKNLASIDPHYIDMFINDFRFTALNKKGEPSYTLRARRLEHYNDSDFAVINEPVIEIEQNNQHWLISAKTGEIDDDRQKIILRNDVVLQQQDTQHPIRLETRQMEIDTHKQTAKSSDTVHIFQRDFNLKSKGMILNNATGELELLKHVEGSYEQHQ